MLKTKTKKESSELIFKLKLNQLPQIILQNYDEDKIVDFINKYDAKYYAVRDMKKSNSSLFNLKVEKNDVLDFTKGQSNFLINVSSFNYTQNQLCVGEIKIEKDMSVSLTVSTNKEYSARDAVRYPEYNFICDVSEARLKRIKGIEQVIDYIFKYELFGIIVEFSSFDIKVGTNKEKVIIYELRTDY